MKRFNLRFPLFVTSIAGMIAVGVVSSAIFLQKIEARVAIDSFGGSATPSELAFLLRPESIQSEIGAFVFVNDVHLEAGPAPHLFFATGIAGKRILVKFQNEKFHLIKPYVTVKVTGVIRKFPNQQIARYKWNLKKDTWKQLSSSLIYIEAHEITNPGSGSLT